MREIKFRAWDGEKMHHLTDCKHPFQSVLVLTNDGWEFGCASYDWEVNGPNSESGCVLMQFTGLKDISKVDVYEGDYFETEDGLMEVFFIDGKFILMWADTGTYRCDLCEAVSNLSKCGNKYENPELLNQ